MHRIYLLLFILLFILLFSFTARSQTASRVIAFAAYGADTTIAATDTGGYKYSGSNGGEILSGVANFKYSYPFVLVQPTDFETGNNGLVKSDSSWSIDSYDTDMSVQFFDDHDNIRYSLNRVYSDGVWYTDETQSYSYDANHNLLVQIDTSWSSPFIQIRQYSYTYDADNRVTQIINFYKNSPDSTQWQSGGKQVMLYNTSGELTVNKSYTWVELTSSFTNPDSDITTFAYTGTHPDSFISVYFPWPGVGSEAVYYFSSANDTMIVSYRSGSVTNMSITDVYDSHHNLISTDRLYFGSQLIDTQLEYKIAYSYNTNNQVTCIRNYNIDTSTGNWVFTGLVRYYYEPYVNTATPTVTSSNELTLFPSPAKGSINVKLAWGTPQPFTFAIYNTAGIKVKEWSIPATQQYDQTISLPRLPPGNYTLSAISANQMLVKQFVLIN